MAITIPSGLSFDEEDLKNFESEVPDMTLEIIEDNDSISHVHQNASFASSSWHSSFAGFIKGVKLLEDNDTQYQFYWDLAVQFLRKNAPYVLEKFKDEALLQPKPNAYHWDESRWSEEVTDDGLVVSVPTDPTRNYGMKAYIYMDEDRIGQYSDFDAALNRFVSTINATMSDIGKRGITIEPSLLIPNAYYFEGNLAILQFMAMAQEVEEIWISKVVSHQSAILGYPTLNISRIKSFYQLSYLEDNIEPVDLEIAVVDTGCQYSALSDSLIGGYDAYTGETLTAEECEDGTEADFSHGTGVGYIISQLNPHASIFSVRAIGKTGNERTVEKGLNHVLTVRNNAKIVNLSLGSFHDNCDGKNIQCPFCRMMYAIKQSGKLPVVASGNNGYPEGSSKWSLMGGYETMCPSKNGISVGAGRPIVGDDEYVGSERAFFSRYGGAEVQKPTFSTFGINIRVANSSGGTNVHSGTSFSAPIVSAMVGWLYYKNLGSLSAVLSSLINNSILSGTFDEETGGIFYPDLYGSSEDSDPIDIDDDDTIVQEATSSVWPWVLVGGGLIGVAGLALYAFGRDE